VTSTVNGSESEFSSFFNVSTDLTIDDEGSPFVSDVPVKFIDPLKSSKGRYSTISVTGVLEHSVFTLELFPNPL
jgi:hypothetical protein